MHVLISFIIILNVFLYDYLTTKVSMSFVLTDEITVSILLLAAVFFILSHKKFYINRYEKRILILLTAILLIGFASLLYKKYQPYSVGIKDAIIFFKCFIIYFITRMVFHNFDISLYKNRITFIFKILFYFIFILTIANYFFHIFPADQTSLGFAGQRLFFPHSSRYAFALQMLFVLLFPAFIEKNRIFLLLVLACGLASMKFKYISFAVIEVFLIFAYSRIGRINVKKYLLMSIPILILLGFIVSNQFLYYYSEDAYEFGYARAILTYNSLPIALDHFPLGAGFGTYASFMSGVYYSPVYELYDMHWVWGLTPANPRFVTDVYWPMLIGQFGIIGFLCGLIIIFTFFGLFIRLFNDADNVNIKPYIFSGIQLMLVLLIDSMSDQIYSQNRGVISFFYLALIVNSAYIKKNQQ
ncbi:MAG: hypothetical protein A2096_11540 [Spirochaetes bacterium GWF1_41_5]|nr:MAG: hypothetical protein A2096_11540 [Spirochaetes bacterium GWF1_41_5]HBE01475.1 hypothetical protein [Spirochaetia bacterium]